MKRRRKKSRAEVKNRLLKSMVEGDDYENDDLNGRPAMQEVIKM